MHKNTKYACIFNKYAQNFTKYAQNGAFTNGTPYFFFATRKGFGFTVCRFLIVKISKICYFFNL